MSNENTVGTNALKLPFPSDPNGALVDLKRGGIKSAGRIKGDKEKLDRYIKVLQILAAHARERFEKEAASRAESRATAANARARIAERQKRIAEARAKELEDAARRTREQAGIQAEGE